MTNHFSPSQSGGGKLSRKGGEETRQVYQNPPSQGPVLPFLTRSSRFRQDHQGVFKLSKLKSLTEEMHYFKL